MSPQPLPPERCILHIDMDAFFASIEQRDKPQLAGKAVIVGALPGTRGVVSAASYEARVYGVHSAMPVQQAFARCPHGVYVTPRMPVYLRESGRVMEILREYSPALEQVSVDEAFLDITGSGRLHGAPVTIAQSICRTIQRRLRLSASIGIGPNMFLAKIASDMQKPGGITVVPRGRQAIEAWLATLPVKKLWGVGHKTEELFHRLSVQSVADLQRLDRGCLIRHFGAYGDKIHRLCRGIDSRAVVSEPRLAKSISRETTYQHDSGDPGTLRASLLSLSQDVARRARMAGLRGRTVYLIYRFSDFQKHTRRRTLAEATWVGKRLYEETCGILGELTPGRPLRLIGVGLTGFEDAAQTTLFPPDAETRWESSEKAVDALTSRFGHATIRRGRELGPARRGNGSNVV